MQTLDVFQISGAPHAILLCPLELPQCSDAAIYCIYVAFRVERDCGSPWTIDIAIFNISLGALGMQQPMSISVHMIFATDCTISSQVNNDKRTQPLGAPQRILHSGFRFSSKQSANVAHINSSRLQMWRRQRRKIKCTFLIFKKFMHMHPTWQFEDCLMLLLPLHMRLHSFSL